jgi:hypothetical protein
MSAGLGSRGTGQAGPPTRWASLVVRTAARPLPTEHRWRYRQEFLAELYGMTPAEQRRHASGVLSRIWTLRLALTDPDRLARKEATMTKPFLCRIGRHRWQRLRNPEGGWYRECRGCGTQRSGLGGPTSSPGGLLPPSGAA